MFITKEKKQHSTNKIGKLYQELAFTDNFMFCKIMEKNHELCRQMLEIILDRKISKIVFVEKENTIDITLHGKSIRLDVYVEDEEETVYDIEMQTVNNKNLPKRSRYYQGMIDLNLIEKGADYVDLKKSMVIFVCTFDFFHKNLPIYTFTNRCKELPELELGDETSKIFINADGSREEWRVEYMTLMMEYRERFNEGYLEGREQGREEGIEQGKEQGLEQGREQGIEALILDNFEDGKSEEIIIGKLIKRFQLQEGEAKAYLDKYAH